MAEAKKIKRVVAHPKCYMTVDGKLQKVAPGTEVSVREDVLKKSGKKFADPKAAKAVVGGELKEQGSATAELEAKLKAAEERAAAAEAQAKAAEDALIASTQKPANAKK